MRNDRGQFAEGSKHLVKHGKSKTRAHRIWCGMRSRCRNPNDPAFSNYGGRGIIVCRRWNDFSAFLSDMGEPPTGYSLDRIDNDGPYSPKNCRWASRKTQNSNQRSSILLTFGGVTLTVADWATRSGVSASTIYARLKNGWEPEAAVFCLKLQRHGIPRGERLRDHQAYGDTHGVNWSDPQARAA